MEKNNYFYGITRLWWMPLITGLIFIGFGIWCLCDPAPSLELFAYIFAGGLGAVGIFNTIYGLCNSGSNNGWGWALACGILEILVAIWLFFLPPAILTTAFVWGMGIYIIIMAIWAICDSFMVSRYASFWGGWLILFLLVSLFFACIFVLGPVGPSIAGWLYIGISFISYGVYRVLYSCKLARINKNLK